MSCIWAVPQNPQVYERYNTKNMLRLANTVTLFTYFISFYLYT
jgi:hypothetical protein